MTFTDALFGYVSFKQYDGEKDTKFLFDFISMGEYDTDAIEQDLMDIQETKEIKEDYS